MEIWTPKQNRSREKWREKGRLAEIQIKNGWSREELAEHFKQEVETKLQQPISTTTTIYNSADFVLRYLFPVRKKKK